jgi:hypothetical protein
MTNCEACGGDDFRVDVMVLRNELMAAIEARKKAELVATQATSELGRCFLKFQQTCVAFNMLKREKEEAQAMAAVLEPRFTT